MDPVLDALKKNDAMPAAFEADTAYGSDGSGSRCVEEERRDAGGV
jgi:hypothetical protein